MAPNPMTNDIPKELRDMADEMCVGPMSIEFEEVEQGKKVTVRQKMSNGTQYELGFVATGDLAKLSDEELFNTVTKDLLYGVLSGQLDFEPEEPCLTNEQKN